MYDTEFGTNGCVRIAAAMAYNHRRVRLPRRLRRKYLQNSKLHLPPSSLRHSIYTFDGLTPTTPTLQHYIDHDMNLFRKLSKPFILVLVITWDFALFLLNIILPARKHGDVVPAGAPGHGLKWPTYEPPEPTDSRSSCEAVFVRLSIAFR